MYKGDNFIGEISPIVGCQRCELAYTRRNITIYRGNPLARVMVIGEGPGEVEDRQGVPMTGPTGSYLVGILKNNGFGLDYIYITNIVLCIPPGVGEKKTREPTGNEQRMCRKWLDLQIRLVDPEIIIAVGKPATLALLPDLERDSSIGQLEGKVFTPGYLQGKIVIPIRHPSGIKRNNSEESYEASLLTICRKMRDILEPGRVF